MKYFNRQDLVPHLTERLPKKQSILVTNREPIVHFFREGKIVYKIPEGGVVSALAPVAESLGSTWVAYGGGTADKRTVDKNDHIQLPPEAPAYTLRRVWLSREQIHYFYDRFANSILWPLSHEISHLETHFVNKDWEMYEEVNKKFASIVLEEIHSSEPLVFIHDYHFALLASFLKGRKKSIKCVYFWHIPWPKKEMFSGNRWTVRFLKGILANDVIGFQTKEFLSNFKATIKAYLGTEVESKRILTAPISTDFEKISGRSASKEIHARTKRLRSRLKLWGLKVILGVDRIDYTKGITNKLEALDALLEEHPELRGKIVFVQVGALSRIRNIDYAITYAKILGLAEYLNKKYGSRNWQPVHLVIGDHGEDSIISYYNLADVLIVASLKDGMNLVAKEFVASRVDSDGVLLLSRFAGAAQELSDALLFDPTKTAEFAKKIYKSLIMKEKERIKRMINLRKVVAEKNVYLWSKKILEVGLSS